MDYPEIAVIRDNRLIRYLTPTPYAYGAEPVFYHRLESRIFLMTFIPGLDPGILKKLMEMDYRAVICQSFGVGGLPGGSDGQMMTQVPYEGSDMAVYQVGKQVKERYRVLEAYNMTLEAAVTKLMWVLGQTNDREEINRLFYIPVQCDRI